MKRNKLNEFLIWLFCIHENHGGAKHTFFNGLVAIVIFILFVTVMIGSIVLAFQKSIFFLVIPIYFIYNLCKEPFKKLMRDFDQHWTRKEMRDE